MEREAKTQKAAIESGEERLENKTVELSAREEETAKLNSDLSRQKKVNEKLKKNLKETRLTLSKCQVGAVQIHNYGANFGANRFKLCTPPFKLPQARRNIQSVLKFGR